MRPLSKVAPDWWDYTTLDREILDDAARLTADDLLQLSRPGFTVEFYDTLEDFYLAEALEYVTAWRQATEDEPAGVCGPIGPTEPSWNSTCATPTSGLWTNGSWMGRKSR
jgi:glucosamine-6-phosphate deaminase